MPMLPDVLRCLALTLCLGASGLAQSTEDKKDFSPAERLLLMSDQLKGLPASTTLHYRFSHRGSLEAPFQDQASVRLSARAQGGCCDASGDFLSGARQLALPEVEQAQGNPVVLYFLEHDIREMKRLTQGSVNYFRKRIRMALYEGATLRELSARYRGRAVAAREISLQPYLNDPNQARFAQHTDKRYRFVLSEAVPGQVLAIHTLTGPASAPLLEDELLLDGAELPPAAAAPAASATTTAQR